ncbi:hypothetical protein BJ508DRAFT_310777 [Ascobolus immersus RN42]|uniref:Uncharacterized protein n=1 Tax=Ascobolus immersus RN42 TaxID=1160509 RepID=A0A3N4HSF8_ASCIM|nr:hypothetical protein BJ508DRAFT_310777 [Ascobolus immersus RN42]
MYVLSSWFLASGNLSACCKRHYLEEMFPTTCRRKYCAGFFKSQDLNSAVHTLVTSFVGIPETRCAMHPHFRKNSGFLKILRLTLSRVRGSPWPSSPILRILSVLDATLCTG